MATQLQIRRGTSAQVAAFTGAEGEIVVNTTNDSIHVNDGSTAGGFELARVDGSNWAITNNISTTANISFGDNDKAIFGAGSDLQIFHDASHSFIKDSGTGHLKIQATNLKLQDVDGNNYIDCIDGSYVRLMHNTATKLETTSTGIDVTGSISADGLTVGATSAPTISIEDSDGGFTASSFSATNGGRDLTIKAPQEVVIQDADTGNKWLRIDEGDISFYEDTGTTPKFFWDASAESLGIGTTNPASLLQLSGSPVATSGALATFRNSDATSSNTTFGGILFNSSPGTDFSIGKANVNAATSLSFRNGNTGASLMDLTSAGNVGIGTSSPDTQLEVSNAASAVLRLSTSDTSVAENQELGALEYSQADISGAGGGVKASIRAKADNSTAAQTYLAFHTSDSSANDVERMRIDSAGNVGIGTSSPSEKLEIRNDVDASTDLDPTAIKLYNNSDGGSAIEFSNGVAGKSKISFGVTSTGAGTDDSYLGFSTGANAGLSEAMRIDSSGNLLVGTTDAAVGVGNTNVGHSIGAAGYAAHSRSGNASLFLNRTGTDGIIASFRKDGAPVGSIGAAVGNAYFSGTARGWTFGGSNLYPANQVGAKQDNNTDLGHGSYRFDDIYATNGTIQTSDRNEKQDIEALSDAEQRVAVAAKGLLRKFRWINSVEENGDDARIHFGIIAQDLQDAFTAEGLDAGRYAMFISSTWTDEDGNEQTRLGVRYSELLAFIISAT